MNNWFFSGQIWARLLVGAGILVSLTILGKALKTLLSSPLMRFFERTKTTLDDRMVKIVKDYVLPLSVLAGIYLGAEHVRAVFTPANVLEHRIIDNIDLATFVALVLIVTSLAVQILKGLVLWYVEEVAEKSRKKITPNVVPVFSKIANIVLFFIALLIILDHVGVNIGGLVVSLGVGSLAVALAAQETISNLIGWFIIIIDQPFRLGDQVKLPTGEEGIIHQIGLRATRILNWDNNIVIVPNGEMVKSRVVNFSLPESTSRVLIELTVEHTADIGEIRRLMLDVAGHHPDLLAEPAPEVFVMNIGDSGILLRFIARSLIGKKFAAETGLREQIYQTLLDHGIRIAVPQRIMKMVNIDGSETSQKK